MRARFWCFAGMSAFVVTVSNAGAQQTDCSKKAERYADLDRLASSCTKMTGADKRKCDGEIRATRQKLDSIYATQCGGGGGSGTSATGPITAGPGASPAMQQVAGQLNGVLGALQQQQDAKDAREAAERADAARQRREEAAERRAEAAAERAAAEARKTAELSALVQAFAMSPDTADPLPRSKAARETCANNGTYIRLMNPTRYATLCESPAPPKPLGPGPAAVPLDAAAPANGLWPAAACFDYSKKLHAQLVAVARQHDAEDTSCRAAVDADPPAWRPVPHDCAAHAKGMDAISMTMRALSMAAIAEINRQYALPRAKRSGCTQYLVDVTTATGGVAFGAERTHRSMLADPPPAHYPAEADECLGDGPYTTMSVVAPLPDIEGVCRALASYWTCRG